MIKNVYNFFTYDGNDPDVGSTVMTIEAWTEEAAWEEFDRLTGPNIILDQVLQGPVSIYVPEI